jgi:hypothetical protein
MSKEEAKRAKHWRVADPYRVDNPEPGMAYAAISEGPSLAEAISVGWEPIQASEYPKLFNGGGYVVNGAYRYKEKVWCMIPANVLEERTAYYADQAKQRAKQSIESYADLAPGLSGEITNKRDE